MLTPQRAADLRAIQSAIEADLISNFAQLLMIDYVNAVMRELREGLALEDENHA